MPNDSIVDTCCSSIARWPTSVRMNRNVALAMKMVTIRSMPTQRGAAATLWNVAFGDRTDADEAGRAGS